jgi:hypothetical protein
LIVPKKADWIAIDDNGKVLFTTQTLGLNPEILESEQIERLNDRLILFKAKKSTTIYFFTVQAAVPKG